MQCIPCASSTQPQAALASTLLPRVEIIASEDPDDEPDYALDDDAAVSVSLDVAKIPLTVTVAQVRDEQVCIAALVASYVGILCAKHGEFVILFRCHDTLVTRHQRCSSRTL